MFKAILIATDGSELGAKGVVQGLDLARALGATVLAVTVSEPWTSISGSLPTRSAIAAYEKDAADSAQRVTLEVAAAARPLGVPCSTLHVPDRRPADGILEAAARHGCDLIVMASHGRGGLGRLLLGSVVMEVLVRATVPVLICR